MTNSVTPIVLNHMTANADKPVHSVTLAKELKLNVNSVHGAMNKILASYPNMRRVQRGTYIWDSNAHEKQASEYMVRVLNKKDDGTMLVQDMDDSTNLFVMKPIEY